MHFAHWIKRGSLLALGCMIVGCGGGGGGGGGNGNSNDPLYVLYREGGQTRLATISRTTGGAFTPIGSLGTGTDVVNSLDWRPETGQLYAYNETTSELLLVDKTTGDASVVGNNTATILGDVSIEFDPVADNVRMITTFEDNVRLSASTGAVLGVDTDLSPVGTLTDIAYSNNTSGASQTTLYGIDAEFNELVRIGGAGGNPPVGAGAVTIVGALGVGTVNPQVAYFDIDADGSAWMVETNLSGAVYVNRLYRINLNTGAATLVGTINSDDPIFGLAAG